MTEELVLSVVKSFNAFARQKPWLDFDVAIFSPFRVTLHAGLDPSAPQPDVEIQFDDVFCVATLMSWKSDTTRPILRVLTDSEAWKVNGRFKVEEGYHLFSFQPEDYPEDFGCLFVAKRLTWRKHSQEATS
jgi:hypothetical protein